MISPHAADKHTMNRPEFTLLNFGFRLFFLLAGVYALVTILVWNGVYVYGWPTTPSLPFTTMHWHAHEMILAVTVVVIINNAQKLRSKYLLPACLERKSSAQVKIITLL